MPRSEMSSGVPREVPDVSDLLQQLFRRSWSPLNEAYTRLSESRYPGVYVIAYSTERLAGQVIKEDQIFYVGVTHAGIGKRLRQFLQGIEDCKHHSGAERFFITVGHGKPYSAIADKKNFFIASISVPCNCLKSERSPKDLRIMGIVAQLEWYVLARVKEISKQEPSLNKK